MTVNNDDEYMNMVSRRHKRVLDEYDKIPGSHNIHDTSEGAELVKEYHKIKNNYEKWLNYRKPQERNEVFTKYDDFVKKVQCYRKNIADDADRDHETVIQPSSSVSTSSPIPSLPSVDINTIKESKSRSTAEMSIDNPKQVVSLQLPMLPVVSVPTVPMPIVSPEPRNEFPHADDPAVYFRFKTSNTNGNPIELIKRLLDKTPPLFGDVGTAINISIELGIDMGHSIVEAKASSFLCDTLGIQVNFDKDHIFLTGTPSKDFDGKLTFSFAGQNTQQSGTTYAKPLFIAPDPRSLWKNLMVADYEGYQNHDEDFCGEKIPDIGKEVVAASCRGRSHAHAAKPRDDYFNFDLNSTSKWMFVAVGDGAGSAKYSRKGSQLACDTAISTLKTTFDRPSIVQSITDKESILKEWKKHFEETEGFPETALEAKYRSEFQFDVIFHQAIHSSYMAIHDESKNRNARIKDYHTTLLVAAFRKFDFGFMFISYWIGDGGMAIIDWNRKGGVLVLGRPDGGDFAGQTRFLTMSEEITVEAIRRRVRFCFADDFEALIQMTDGVADPFFPAENDVMSAERWTKFWTVNLRQGCDGNAGCRELSDRKLPSMDKAKALRKWLDFWSKGNHDDRTILIVQ